MRCFACPSAIARACAGAVRAARPSILIALLLASSLSHAAEISFLEGLVVGGVSDTRSTYPWELQYLQRPFSQVGLSFSYLNEGRFSTPDEPPPVHHARDGAALQVWALTPRQLEPLEFALGVGPYVYFDTRSEPHQYDEDYHGVAGIATGSVRYSWRSGWFARIDLSEIHAPGEVDTRLIELGVGYRAGSRFDGVDASLWGRDSQPPASVNQIALLAGRTAVCNWNSEQSSAYAVEYRRAMTRHFEVSAMALDEGDGSTGRHWGLVGSGWLLDDFWDRRLSVGVGAGAYAALQTHRTEDGRPTSTLNGMVAMTVSWRLRRSLAVRVDWFRGFTSNNDDRDVVLGGLVWMWD